MFSAFSILQVAISVMLIGVILLQEGKKGMGAIFGGSSSSVFGAKGAGNILTKMTTVLAVLFMLNSIWIAHLSSDNSSVVDTIPQISAPADKAVDAVKPEEKAETKDTATAPEKTSAQETVKAADSAPVAEPAKEGSAAPVKEEVPSTEKKEETVK